MSNRHLARTLAMQALYQWDFLAYHPERNVDEIVRYIREEFAPEFNDHDYVEKTVRGVVEHVTEIDRTLEQFAKEWLVSAMTLVDRNVLRIGAYELLMNPNIPAKVAINEAIEIAKAFGDLIVPWLILFVTILYVLLIRRMWQWKGEFKNNDGECVCHVIFTAVLPLILCLAMCIWGLNALSDSICYLYNPEYYAIRDLINILMGGGSL